MPPASDQTLSATHGSHGRTLGHEPYLVLVLDTDHPNEPSVRLSLFGLDKVTIGRGERRLVRFSEDGSERSLDLRIADPRSSSRHAELVHALGQWVAADLGSKNGTRLGGRNIDRAPLEDGALLEVGHSFFIFRDTETGSRVEPRTLEVSGLTEVAVGLTTLHPGFAQALEELSVLAGSDVPVILHGESGTGKEVLAQAIHHMSNRRGALVPINCGALSQGLVESELFGHRKGAFTGANEDRMGLVRSADGGTLFLDEIGDLVLPAQASLLRVLQEREVMPVGGARAVQVDFRLIAATHHDLPKMVERGAFRADLYARLTGFTLALPPLRERREDLGLLISALARRHGHSGTLHPDAARALFLYSWPLNVRELERTLQAAAVLAGQGPIDQRHLPAPLRELDRGLEESEAHPLSEAEQDLKDNLIQLLKAHGGNISQVARELGKARMQIQRWIKRFGIPLEIYRR